jgi:hypothetical protein
MIAGQWYTELVFACNFARCIASEHAAYTHQAYTHDCLRARAHSPTQLHTYKYDDIDKGSNERAVAPFTQLEIQDTHAQLSSGFKTKTTVRNHTNYGVTKVLKDCSLTVLWHMPRWESCFMEAQSTVWWWEVFASSNPSVSISPLLRHSWCSSELTFW